MHRVGSRAWPKRPSRNLLRKGNNQANLGAEYRALLARLDPEKGATSLGNGVVMWCWEAPALKCHRRLVAEWPEGDPGDRGAGGGLPRRLILPSAHSPDKGPERFRSSWATACADCGTLRPVLLSDRTFRCGACGRRPDVEP
jgi:hypothetical protein